MTLTGLLHLLPLLALLVPLLFGRYVGEEKVSRLRARLAPASSPRPVRRASSRRRVAPRALMPRGGRLLGSALAVRPPPVRGAALT